MRQQKKIRGTRLYACLLLAMLFAAMIVAQLPVRAVDNSQYYVVNGDVVEVSLVQGAAVHKAVNAAISYASSVSTASRRMTVRVPAGSYNLEGTIHMMGNVILDCTGVTFAYTLDSGNMLMLGDKSMNEDSQYMSGYGTLQNFSVIGGTWKGNAANTSSLFRMAHSKKVSLEKCTFAGGGCAHQVELAAIDGLTVDQCTFRDMKGNGSDEKQEALQIDVPCSQYVFGGTVLDGTPMKNVVVSNCTFTNVPRGVGSHSMVVGYYHDNMKILNNTFTNVQGACIIALNYINTEISGNQITNCGEGILFQTFKKDAKAVYNTIYDGQTAVHAALIRNANSTIHDNTITVVDTPEADEVVGIKLYGVKLTKATKATGKGSTDTIQKEDYYVQGVTVQNNVITSAGHGIHLLDARDCQITGNQVTGTGKAATDGIFVEFASAGITIADNQIRNAKRMGILVQNHTRITAIENNVIAGTGEHGISIYDNSRVTDAISKNKISGCKKNAIIVNRKSTCKNIVGNTITASKAKGIFVTEKSELTGEISGNTIRNMSGEGINVNSGKGGFAICNNTVSKCGSWPVIVKVSGKKQIRIARNTLASSKKFTTIQVSAGVVDIRDNRITSGRWPVFIASGSKGTIGYNQYKKCDTAAYMVLGSRKKGTKIVNGAALSGVKITGKAKTIAGSWKKAEAYSGYVVEYATTSDFVGAKTVTTKKTSVTIKKVPAGTYYVRVYGTTKLNGVTVYSKYGKVKTVTVK